MVVRGAVVGYKLVLSVLSRGCGALRLDCFWRGRRPSSVAVLLPPDLWCPQETLTPTTCSFLASSRTAQALPCKPPLAPLKRAGKRLSKMVEAAPSTPIPSVRVARSAHILSLRPLSSPKLSPDRGGRLAIQQASLPTGQPSPPEIGHKGTAKWGPGERSVGTTVFRDMHPASQEVTGPAELPQRCHKRSHRGAAKDSPVEGGSEVAGGLWEVWGCF